jgi:Dna[CI] antecedent, DciA
VRRHGGIENLSALVARVYPGRSRDELDAVRAFGAFIRALSPRILRNARPVKLMRGTLIVHTSNSAWANSLQLECEHLLAKVKRVTPDSRIRKLVFRAGPLPDAALPLPHTPLVKNGGIPLKELPEEIARELVRIHNDGLREAVARAASVGLATERETQDNKSKRREE